MSMKRFLPAVLLGLVAAGCVAPAPPPVVALPEAVSPAPASPPVSVPPATPPPPQETPASITTALVDVAKGLEQSGSPAEAAAAIEQAIRIEPRRGELWLQLAAIRLQAGQPALAEQNARKGLLFVPRGSDDERAAWLLIADARAAQGDLATARDLRQRWQ